MADISLEDLMRTTAAGTPYGITDAGFVPKSVARLLEEKVAAARVVFGDDLDLTSGSAIRKLCELMALEEARVWEHLGIAYADSFVATATGDALSMLGAEVGIERPHHRATGQVTVTVAGDLPSPYDVAGIRLPRGTRLLTDDGHDYFLDDTVELSNDVKQAPAAVKAFDPGPASNLDASTPTEVLNHFNEHDRRSDAVRDAASRAGADVIAIVHSTPTTGGQEYWADEPYRDLLLSYPRNLWTPDALRVAITLVPGVRQVLVKDLYGGLDINQSIFGNFGFIERLFSQERSLGDPYYVTVLVAPGEGAIWAGPGQLRDRVRRAVDEVRPIGIVPRIELAEVVGVSFGCRLAVEGVPIPVGLSGDVNSSPAAIALKQRILDRVRRYVQHLEIGAPVRYSEVLWAIMEEPGVVDAKQLQLRRYPPLVGDQDLTAGAPQTFACEQDVVIAPSQVAELVDDLAGMVLA
jgi:hypothetical protein